jgi:UDP-N-acetyl-D-galactosamine dehydrogenase
VDPYFLVHKAKSLGYTPEVILSGRNVNDQMGKFVASKVIRLMKEKGIKIEGSKALILGVTFKENCNDIRNSKVPDIYRELKESGLAVDLYDPIADGEQVTKTHQITLTKTPSKYQAIILAVSHDLFIENGVKDYKNPNGAVIYDIKSVLNRAEVDGRL